MTKKINPSILSYLILISKSVKQRVSTCHFKKLNTLEIFSLYLWVQRNAIQQTELRDKSKAPKRQARKKRHKRNFCIAHALKQRHPQRSINERANPRDSNLNQSRCPSCPLNRQVIKICGRSSQELWPLRIKIDFQPFRCKVNPVKQSSNTQKYIKPTCRYEIDPG